MVQVRGLTPPEAIPAGHRSSPDTPPHASHLRVSPGRGEGLQCPGSEPPKGLAVGDAGVWCALSLAGMAA